MISEEVKLKIGAQVNFSVPLAMQNNTTTLQLGYVGQKPGCGARISEWSARGGDWVGYNKKGVSNHQVCDRSVDDHRTDEVDDRDIRRACCCTYIYYC